MSSRSRFGRATVQTTLNFCVNMKRQHLNELSSFLYFIENCDEEEWHWKDGFIVLTPFPDHPSTKVYFNISCAIGSFFPYVRFYIVEEGKKVVDALRYKDHFYLYRIYGTEAKADFSFDGEDELYASLFDTLQPIFETCKENPIKEPIEIESPLPDFTAFKIDDNDIEHQLLKLADLQSTLIDNLSWLTTEESHKITHTYPHDLALSFSLYNSMNSSDEELITLAKKSIRNSVVDTLQVYESLAKQVNERKKQRILQQEQVIKIRSDAE